MNTMRVYLHDMAWVQDPDGFVSRVDEYLRIAESHNIKTIFVFFDSCWNPFPRTGLQPEPSPGVHNSGWVQSPSQKVLMDLDLHAYLEPYVTSVMKRFREDPRILAWDLYNEPANSGNSSHGGFSPEPAFPIRLKERRTYELMVKTVKWARVVGPSQPITIGVWGSRNWLQRPDAFSEFSLEVSDIITFHSYDGPEPTNNRIEALLSLGRPIICTEYMARGRSDFKDILPLLHRNNIGAINWGLVNGKSQTIYPWSTRNTPFDKEPETWFHDILRKDGSPFDPDEISLMQKLIRSNGAF